MLFCLGSEPVGPSEDDVALIVSELVTNSVVHAHVGSSQQLTISVAQLKDRVRIAVTDGGSETMPHLREPDDARVFVVPRRTRRRGCGSIICAVV